VKKEIVDGAALHRSCLKVIVIFLFLVGSKMSWTLHARSMFMNLALLVMVIAFISLTVLLGSEHIYERTGLVLLAGTVLAGYLCVWWAMLGLEDRGMTRREPQFSQM
jgi:hypothetical protein